MLDSFISYLNFERRSSPHTILAYQQDLAQFQAFLIYTFDGLTTQSAEYSHIRSWIVSLVEVENSSRTVNRKIASLRAYYKFLLKKEAISKDPTTKVTVLKVKKRLPQFVEEADIIDLLEKEETEGSQFIILRNRLIIELFYGTGMRLSELIGIKNESISLFESVIKVLGKRNKERVIPINKSLFSLIKEYIEIRRKEFPVVEHDSFLLTAIGAPVYPKLVYRVVKNKLSMISNLDKRSPHILRHTFATHLLEKGADLNAIKDLLGHSSLAATQIYTHNSIEKLKAIFNQAHPKA